MEKYTPLKRKDINEQTVRIDDKTDENLVELSPLQSKRQASISFSDSSNQQWRIDIQIRNDNEAQPPEINVECVVRCGARRRPFTIPRRALKTVHRTTQHGGILVGLSFMNKSIAIGTELR
ncbi:MAG: hypothetical protein HYY37_01205 [Candidatus Aenigmarchaeota archaeon]|nr:hypothetical protein [Candidatus Aenigmarchaeota archaeon]